MKLISWNVNGLRAFKQKEDYQKLVSSDADIICMQETKCQDEQIEVDEFRDYFKYSNSAVKKGYSGTLVLTKIKPVNVTYGINMDVHDQEGRVITLEYDNFYLVNVYVPNSQNELKRLDYRQQWDSDFKEYLNNLALHKSVLICGDLNVAHNEIDIKNPDSNHKNAGFSDEERSDFTVLLDSGFIDTYRYLHPQKVEYSWWSYRFNARAKGIGWRIDYWLVSNDLKDKVKNSEIYGDWYGSDHAPIALDIEL